MNRRFETVVFLLIIIMNANLAVAATPNPLAEAAIRDGKSSYNNGNYEAAIQSFKRAYALESNSEILYQLGKAYAMADWPVEAVDAFERYLGAARSGLSEKRQLELAEAIEGQKRRIGTLALQVTPPKAKVILDDAILEPSAYAKPVALRQGSHVLTASLDGYLPQIQAIQVRGRQLSIVKLALLPVPSPVVDGALDVRCPMPGVAILVDERQVATTAVNGPILIPEGSHSLRLERPGYRPQKLTIEIARTKATAVECDLPMLEPPVVSGRLELEVSPADGIEVFVDGRRAATTNVLPPGAHAIEIRHYGFEPWSRTVEVSVGNVERVSVGLIPTAAYWHDVERRAQQRRTWATVMGATGIALAGTAVGLGLWNDKRYSDWKQQRTDLENDYRTAATGVASADDLESRRNDVNRRLRAIHAVDIATAMLGVAGGMLLGSGTLLFFTTDDPPGQRRDTSARLRLPQGLGMNVAW